ncbi:MAG: transcriptional repressor LexA [Syntrophomonadaceae bacterium]
MGNLKPLNKRQQAILDYIKQQLKSNGYPPSVREIGAAVGLKSSSTVHSYLVQLEEMGYIRKDPTKPRTLIPISDDSQAELISESLPLPLVGNVAAGTPILAEQNIDTYIPVPVEMVGSGTHFMLKVKGDSMIEAGIFDGDYLIVKQQAQASNGEIVVALLENEATVKRFYKRENFVELVPENSALEPIRTTQVEILGKVSGLMRKM